MGEAAHKHEYVTGYFVGGEKGKKGKRSKVHIIEYGKPVCNAKNKVDGEFQWCANGIMLDYVTCSACKEWYKHEYKLIKNGKITRPKVVSNTVANSRLKYRNQLIGEILGKLCATHRPGTFCYEYLKEMLDGATVLQIEGLWHMIDTTIKKEDEK